jgi:hypothetical protein
MTVALVTTRHAMWGGDVFKLDSDNSGGLFRKVFSAAFKRLRSIDGIDETSSAAAQVFPGIGQPIAATALLSVATPFVVVGAAGAVSDCHQQIRDYPDLLKALSARQKLVLQAFEKAGVAEVKLTRLQRCHQKLEQLIAKYEERQQTASLFSTAVNSGRAAAKLVKLRAGGALSRQFFKQAQLLAKHTQTAEIACQLSLYKLQEQQRHIARIDRDFSVSGASAMVGMSAGMFPATAKAVTDIVAKATDVTAKAGDLTATAINTTATSVSETMGIVSGAVFLPAQAAMAGYGVAKAITGKKRDQQLHNAQLALNVAAKTEVIDASTAKSVQALLDRKRHYNKMNSTIYGQATAVGQGFMMAGTVATMTGAATPVTLPLFAVGVPLTAGAAGVRAVYEHKEENFIGEGATLAAQSYAAEHTLDALQQKSMTMHEATQTIAGNYQSLRKALVRVKLLSLMNHVLQEERKKNYRHLTPEQLISQRHQRVEAMLVTGKKDALHGTSLLPDELRLMREVYRNEGGRTLISGTKTSAVEDSIALELNKLLVRDMDAARTLDKLHDFQTDAAYAAQAPDREQKMDDSVMRYVVQNAYTAVADQVFHDTLNALTKKAKEDADIKAFFTAPAGTKQKEIQSDDLEQFIEQNATAKAIYQTHLVKHLLKQTKLDLKFLRHDAAENLVKGAHNIQSLRTEFFV